MRYPVATLAFEKVLLATAFSNAAMVQSWGLVAAVGASHAPFYLLPLLCGLFHLLACPLITSFSVRGVKASPGLLLEQAACHMNSSIDMIGLRFRWESSPFTFELLLHGYCCTRDVQRQAAPLRQSTLLAVIIFGVACIAVPERTLYNGVFTCKLCVEILHCDSFSAPETFCNYLTSSTKCKACI